VRTQPATVVLPTEIEVVVAFCYHLLSCVLLFSVLCNIFQPQESGIRDLILGLLEEVTECLESIELYCGKSTSSSTAADSVGDGYAAAEPTICGMGGTGVSGRSTAIGAAGGGVVAAAESDSGTVKGNGRGSCGVMRLINGANDG
jgi:hypothetical protein